MIVFFLACLKINIRDVLRHLKKPKFLIYIVIMYLILIPAFIYEVFRFINPELAVGMLLLSSMPPGVASVVFTDILEGNTSMSMAISIPAYLFSPFTVLLLFFVLTQKQINIDLGNLFRTLMVVNFLPLIVAQIFIKTSKGLIEKTKNYYSIISICGIAFLIYLVVAIQSAKILSNPYNALNGVLWMFLLFTALYIIGYFLGFWRKKRDKIALAVTKTYMNNALAVGIAITFFSPKIALLMVLSEIPYATTQGFFKYVTKYLD